MVYRRRALSEVISTTILVSAMLIIVVGVMGFAVDLFSIQTQNAEFSQAQNSMISLAQGVDSIIPTPGAAAYARFNTRSGGPVFSSSFDMMNLSITYNGNNTVYPILNMPINELRYVAGAQVSFIGDQWIRAGNFTGTPVIQYFNNTLIIQNNSAPLGFVYISHDSGATWINLDYRRVNIINLGIFNVSTGVNSTCCDAAGNPIYTGNYQLVDIIQVNLVKVVSGTFGGASSIVISVLNTGVNTTNVAFYPPSNLPLVFNVTLTSKSLASGQPAFAPSDSVQVPVPFNYTNQYGTFNVSTVVMLSISTIQLSTSGG
jgi:hypothetical protein